MRCPDCGKFVPFDTEVEPEETADPEFDGSEFTATYTRQLNCGECGTELKSAEIEVSITAEIEEPEESEAVKPDDLDNEPVDEEDEEEHVHEWEVTAEVEPTMRTITKDRHGKPIKKARYMKTEYGVSVQFQAECECGAKAAASAEEYVQASSMDELV